MSPQFSFPTLEEHVGVSFLKDLYFGFSLRRKGTLPFFGGLI